MDIVELRYRLKKAERLRTLWMWHEHSTVLSYGLVLVMVGVTYDPLTFYTDEEVPNSSNHMSLQEFIEHGEIHILAHCSSTSSDQASLIPERVACLESLSVPIITENGITLKDTSVFFKGDKQSAWFEAGVTRGGNYCCVACTCHTSHFADISHVFSCKERSFSDIQAMAIAGIFGKKPNLLTFYEGLSADDLRKELVSRQMYDFANFKQDKLRLVKDTLCGIQKVPSLLLLDPTVDPSTPEYNLGDYCELPFEPLHDLKGYLNKLLTILPEAIKIPSLKVKTEAYLQDFFKKPKLYGSDFREAIIQVMSIFVDSGLDQTDPLFVLAQTIAKVTEIVYSRDNKCCPLQCLQFYNCSFLHQQLYIDLFAPNRLSIYCHALFFHGPVQHEYVCSRSVNTEAEERLFEQA